MDKCYCIVRIIRIRRKCIQISVYQQAISLRSCSYMYPLCITASTSKQVFQLLMLTTKVYNFALEHLFYICIELYKAEIALMFGQPYIQE